MPGSPIFNHLALGCSGSSRFCSVFAPLFASSLAIEQGNTNSVFAVHDGERWIAQWRSATEPNRTADEYVVWLWLFATLMDRVQSSQ
jgi:hypothetical protein